MAASPDLLLAVALCFLLRLAGHAQPFESHPVLASFLKVDACYLDCKASDTHFQRWQQGLD